MGALSPDLALLTAFAKGPVATDLAIRELGPVFNLPIDECEPRALQFALIDLLSKGFIVEEGGLTHITRVGAIYWMKATKFDYSQIAVIEDDGVSFAVKCFSKRRAMSVASKLASLIEISGNKIRIRKSVNRGIYYWAQAWAWYLDLEKSDIDEDRLIACIRRDSGEILDTHETQLR